VAKIPDQGFHIPQIERGIVQLGSFCVRQPARRR
jgi:hypothetical protein